MFSNIIDLLIPPKCHVCGETLLHSERFVCTQCCAALPRTMYHVRKDNPVEMRFAGWGRNKIRAGLYAKGIAADDIKAGLDAIEEGDYIEAMLKTGRAKASRLDLHTRTDAAKFIRHMQSRGFESGPIFQLLDALRMDAGD